MNFNSYLEFFLHFHTLSFIISDGCSCLLEQERSVISVNRSEDFMAHRMFKKEVPSNNTSSLGKIATIAGFCSQLRKCFLVRVNCFYNRKMCDAARKNSPVWAQSNE